MDEQLRKEIRRFRLAQADMEQAAAAAGFLHSRGGGTGSLYRAVETGLVVCYARPFGATNRVGEINKDEWAPDDPELQMVHYRLLERRDQVYAHNDETDARGVEDLGPLFGSDFEGVYVEAYRPIDRERLPQIRELAGQQERRFRAEADKRQAKTPPHLRS